MCILPEQGRRWPGSPGLPCSAPAVHPGRCRPQEDDWLAVGNPCPHGLKAPRPEVREARRANCRCSCHATVLQASRVVGSSAGAFGGHAFGPHRPTRLCPPSEANISRNRVSRSREISEDLLGLPRGAPDRRHLGAAFATQPGAPYGQQGCAG